MHEITKGNLKVIVLSEAILIVTKLIRPTSVK